MFRPATRLIARPGAVRSIPRVTAPTRRLLSTAPPTEKSRSWKSLVARVGLAGAIIYYYNTTDLFGDEPRRVIPVIPETETETEQLPTIDAIAEERKRRKLEAAKERERLAAEKAAAEKAAAEKARSEAEAAGEEGAIPGGAEGLQEEADQQGAFNPETGEINWDCPCLGGMAHGPCGEEFKAAFSCFVYSTEEPKGMDCVEKFKGMQDCFRQYPEIYGSELDTDDEDDVTADQALADVTEPEPLPVTAAGEEAEPLAAPAIAQPAVTEKPRPSNDDNAVVPDVYREKAERRAAAEKAKEAVQDAVPKASHDATDAKAQKE
ncbi:hypothetical protein M011DRAFT_228880 [Sporormia fimetaria CBS 119925]|uniref:Mitochondrial intermembrane space import and assembly protein 40 n=1 Tax=Sporormia fimetaria CBS 119925 TaxID=1340428 RepID=A0A6A6VIS6_9PLEO|nr:hypothetical protein M011DRAFT_228880 [Sporormia fimetaria CBS 119925]